MTDEHARYRWYTLLMLRVQQGSISNGESHTCWHHVLSTRSVSESASDTHCLSDMYSPTGQVLCLRMIDPEIASVTDIDSPQTHALHASWTDTPSPKHMNSLSPHLLHGESISVRHRVSGCIGFDIDIYWFATDFFQIKHTCTPSSRWTASACQVSMSDIFCLLDNCLASDI